MALNIERLKQAKKEKRLSYDDLVKMTGYSRSTITNIFNGYIQFPRHETVDALERALGLKDELTPEEIEAGMGHHAVVLSDEDSYRLDVLARAEETLGKPYVDGVMALIEFNITEAKKSKKAKIST